MSSHKIRFCEEKMKIIPEESQNVTLIESFGHVFWLLFIKIKTITYTFLTHMCRVICLIPFNLCELISKFRGVWLFSAIFIGCVICLKQLSFDETLFALCSSKGTQGENVIIIQITIMMFQPFDYILSSNRFITKKSKTIRNS